VPRVKTQPMKVLDKNVFGKN